VIEISWHEALGTETSAGIEPIEGFEKQELEEGGRRETAEEERGGGFGSREWRNRRRRSRSNRRREDGFGGGGGGADEDSDVKPLEASRSKLSRVWAWS